MSPWVKGSWIILLKLSLDCIARVPPFVIVCYTKPKNPGGNSTAGIELFEQKKTERKRLTARKIGPCFLG